MRFPQGVRDEGACAPGMAAFTLDLDPELLVFRGHFPGNPILPGVVQVDWAVHFGTQAFGPLGHFRSIDQLKFMDVIRPGDALELRLDHDPDRGHLKFSYYKGSIKASAGIIRFALGGN